MDAGSFDQFPVFGPALGMGIYAPYPAQSLPIARNPSSIPLYIGPENYGAFCDPAVKIITESCIEQFPYDSHSGQYQYGSPRNVPMGAENWTQQRKPHPFWEWAFMGLFQLQRPETQYADTKSAYGPDKQFTGSFNDWVTGPWLVAIQQEVYHQYNGPLETPWGR